ncbi:uncharacterized protein METZ01_LOCUS332414 [marine metagenome]|uniref:Uncharacterized protein n=1 Tax=marine metagenome TaxID=408172 RepID=A0A382Q3J8_9ZZZZ
MLSHLRCKSHSVHGDEAYSTTTITKQAQAKATAEPTRTY